VLPPQLPSMTRQNVVVRAERQHPRRKLDDGFTASLRRLNCREAANPSSKVASPQASAPASSHRCMRRRPFVALVPRLRAHLTRYHGVLAPAFAARAQIVPGGNGGVVDIARVAKPDDDVEGTTKTRRPGRFPLASLIWRVFLKDVLECARCSGRMEIVANATVPADIVRILEHIGLPSEAPAAHPPGPLPQSELPFNVSGFEPDPPAPDDFDA
jgi:hypothetical protein